MRWTTALLLLLAPLALIACTQNEKIAPDATHPADVVVARFDSRPTREQRVDLEWAVLVEGHQPWRLDIEMVAESELEAHLTDAEKTYDRTTYNGAGYNVWNITRRGSRVTAIIQHNEMEIEVFLENTRRDGTGCWFTDHVVITRPVREAAVRRTIGK